MIDDEAHPLLAEMPLPSMLPCPDDDAQTLHASQSNEYEAFRASLIACETDEEKFQLCEEQRRYLLDRDDDLRIEVAAYDKIMSSECEKYRLTKRTQSGRPKNLSDEYEAEWERLLGLAASTEELSQCSAALKIVSQYWGWDKIRYYKWAHRGLKYCKKLRAAANQNPSWDDDVRVKLPQLQLRRTQLLRGRCIRFEVDPLEAADLVRLKEWDHKNTFSMANDPARKPLPFQKLTRVDIPEGHGFDKFGLLVQQSFAIEYPTIPPAATGTDLNSTSIEQTHVVPAPVNNAGGNVAGNTNMLTCGNDGSEGALIEGARIFHGDIDTDSAPGGADEPAVLRPDHADEESNGVHRQSPTIYPSPHPSSPDESSDRDEQHRRNERTHKRRTQRPLSYKESKLPRKGRASVRKAPSHCGCPSDIPYPLLSALSLTTESDYSHRLEMTMRNAGLQDRLCHEHLRILCGVLSDALTRDTPAEAELGQGEAITDPNSEANIRKRPHSSLLEGAGATSDKRFRANGQDTLLPMSGPPHISDRDHDTEALCREIVAQLENNLLQSGNVPTTHGERTDKSVLTALRGGRTPQSASEALVCNGTEAMEAIEEGRIDVPIFTEGEQQFRWSRNVSPLQQIFRRMEDSFETELSVQISSRKLIEASAEKKSLSAVRERLLEQTRFCKETWNVLGARNPLPSLLPGFLMGENARLLHQAGDLILTGETTVDACAPQVKWDKWKNVLEWILLAAGYNTGPHRDAYGFATWITLQEGQIIFGWLSNPTDQEVHDWTADPYHYASQRWRYMVLNPGQTVFIPSGLIHYVARRDESRTFAVGGHLLFWSGVDQWSKVVIEELQHSETTNEDMGDTLPYVSAIEKLVKDKQTRGQVKELGGDEALATFYTNIEMLKSLL